MQPTHPDGPPRGPAPARPGAALGFALVLFVLVLPDVLAQGSSRLLGLAWSELFVLLLPALVAAAGSNLRPLPYLGLDRPRARPVLLAAGLGAAGFLAANGVMVLWVSFLPPRFVDAIPDVARIFDGPPAVQVVVAAVAVLLAPFCEEVAFRGYLQRTLSRTLRPAAAIGLTALVFGVRHLDPLRFPALVALGSIFGWVAWRSGSVWPAVAAHVANNALATGVALLVRPGADAAQRPAPSEALGPLLAGGAAIALLAGAFRRATPTPPAPEDALALRDPADPSTGFRLHRVPRPLLAAAWIGLATLSALFALALLTPAWEKVSAP